MTLNLPLSMISFRVEILLTNSRSMMRKQGLTIPHIVDDEERLFYIKNPTWEHLMPGRLMRNASFSGLVTRSSVFASPGVKI
jgi:hypothetical protein